MDYKEPATLYHMDASPSRDSNLQRLIDERRSADSSFSLGYATEAGELFLGVPRELSVLLEKVLRRERKVSQLMGAVPGIAGDEVLRSLAFDEVISSNSIENIHSTRRQIGASLKASSQESMKARRFREFARLYLELITGESEVPESPADLRAIYDRVMDSEDLEHEPDGMLFRRGEVLITDGVKVRHAGLLPESRIIEAMEAMLRIARSDEMPSVYRALISHYIFEYAHPFYDGNGRTGRYLLSLFLEEALSKPTALSLSRVIAENKPAYYQAFETVEDPLNHGETTFFVATMLDFIYTAQGELFDKLERAKVRYDLLCEHSAQLELQGRFSKREASLIFILAQQASFGMFDDMALERLAELLALGTQQTRNHLGRLENQNVVRKVRGRAPITFALTEEFEAEAFPDVRESPSRPAGIAR